VASCLLYARPLIALEEEAPVLNITPFLRKSVAVHALLRVTVSQKIRGVTDADLKDFIRDASGDLEV